jgi:hypothetical protein
MDGKVQIRSIGLLVIDRKVLFFSGTHRPEKEQLLSTREKNCTSIGVEEQLRREERNTAGLKKTPTKQNTEEIVKMPVLKSKAK